MLAAVSAPDPDPEIALTATAARVSTIDGRWAYADVSGTHRGEQLQGARYVLRRADPTAFAWNIATVGSSLGGCRFMRGLGMPAAVVDDLGVSHEISYSCVNPPPTAVPCLVNRPGAWLSLARRRPQRCDLSLSGDDQPSNPWFMRLRALKWIRIGDDEAVAVGAILGNHYPFTPAKVRVRFRGRLEAYCGPQYARAVVSTRYGHRSGPLSFGQCPRVPQDR